MCQKTQINNKDQVVSKKKPEVIRHDDQHDASPSNNQNDVTIVLRLMMAFAFFFSIFPSVTSVFLVVERGWTPGAAGTVWFTRDVSAIICSPFIGAFIDRSEHKRALLLLSLFVGTIAAVCVIWTQNFTFLIVKSIIEGAAMSFVQPIKNAMILGLIGQERFDGTSKKVEMVEHLGSFSIISIAGIIGILYPNIEGVFYTIGLSGLLACFALIFMPLSIHEEEKEKEDEEEVNFEDVEELSETANSFCRKKILVRRKSSLINYESSRNLDVGGTPATYISILKNKDIVLFGCSVFFFHLGSSSVLPLLSKLMSIDSGSGDLSITCANIGIAQFSSIFSVWAMGSYIEKGKQHKVPILIGYITAVPLRCIAIIILNKYWPNQYALMATQLLDGIGAGTFGLSLPLVLKVLTKGTGHFSFSFGAVSTLYMCGAALSNLISGFIVTFIDYSTGFVSLAVMGSISVILMSFVNVDVVHIGIPTEDEKIHHAFVARPEEESYVDVE